MRKQRLGDVAQDPVLWVVLCPLKRYAEVLTPTTLECDLIWKYGRCRVIFVSSYYRRVGSVQYDWCPCKKWCRDTETHTEKKALWGWRSEISVGQGMLEWKTTWEHRETTLAKECAKSWAYRMWSFPQVVYDLVGEIANFNISLEKLYWGQLLQDLKWGPKKFRFNWI